MDKNKKLRLRQQRASTKDWRNKAAAEPYRILKSGKPVQAALSSRNFAKTSWTIAQTLTTSFG